MDELESRGLVTARSRSGYYVRSPRSDGPTIHSLPQPMPLTGSSPLTAIVRSVYEAATRPDVCKLGPDGPSPVFFPTEKLNRALSREARRIGVLGSGYGSLAGTLELRQEIAYRASFNGMTVSSEDIIVTAGCTEALTLCLRATTKPGDTVAVESPAYYGALLTLESLQLKPIEIQTDRALGLNVDALAHAIKRHPLAAVLVGANFNNPHGALMPDSEKRRLVELISNYNIPLIEDDIFGDLYFTAQRPVPLKALDRTGDVLLCDSYSKSLAPGYRVGWTIPGKYLGRVIDLKFAQSDFTSILPQLGIYEYMRSGGYPRHIRSLREIFCSNIKRTAKIITETFPAGTRFIEPRGGIFLWIELPPEIDAIKLHLAAAEHAISVAPGNMFSPSGCGFSNYVRINCSRSWGKRIEAALHTLGNLAHEQVNRESTRHEM